MTKGRVELVVCGLTARRCFGCYKFFTSTGGLAGYWNDTKGHKGGVSYDVLRPGGVFVGRAKTTSEARRLLRPASSSG